MNIKSIISIKLATAFVLTFGLGVMAQAEGPLDADAVASLVEELTDGLPDLIGDEKAIGQISEKWKARKGLVGKAKPQVLNLLFADVRSVISDKGTQDSIWEKWTSKKKGNEETAPQVTEPKDPGTDVKSVVKDPLDDCPTFPSELVGIMRWEVLRVPNMLLCRALLTDSGAEAFALTISPESPFKPRRSDRAESARLNGRELIWYRSKPVNEPNVEVREALIEIAEDRVVHVSMRASDAQTLSKYQKYVLSLPFPNYVD